MSDDATGSNTKTNRHAPVMPDEVLEQLRLQSGMTIVDATLGNAGHSELIAAAIGSGGTLVGIDADPLALTESADFLQHTDATVHLIHDNFSNLAAAVADLEIKQVDGVLMDLGLRRGSLEDTGRGFSFNRPDEPLDMRFDPSNNQLLTAAELVNTLAEDTMADMFYHLSDERLARRYAAAIVRARQTTQIETVGDLVEILEQATPRNNRRPGRSPATKVFQALRMTVNSELEKLEQGINGALSLLRPGGRLVVITFHSVEDRAVKRQLKQLATAEMIVLDPKKAIKPSHEEIVRNKLSRSAVLRAITKN